MWFGSSLQKSGLDFVFLAVQTYSKNNIVFCCLSELNHSGVEEIVRKLFKVNVPVFDLQVSLIPAFPGPSTVCDKRGERSPLQ